MPAPQHTHHDATRMRRPDVTRMLRMRPDATRALPMQDPSSALNAHGLKHGTDQAHTTVERVQRVFVGVRECKLLVSGLCWEALVVPLARHPVLPLPSPCSWCASKTSALAPRIQSSDTRPGTHTHTHGGHPGQRHEAAATMRVIYACDRARIASK